MYVAVKHVFDDAGVEMIGQNHIPEGLKRALYGGKLYENISAVAVVVKHTLYAVELTYRAVKPRVQGFEIFVVARNVLMLCAYRTAVV